MTRITENYIVLNNEKNDIPSAKKMMFLCLNKMTQITENDFIEKNDVPLPKK